MEFPGTGIDRLGRSTGRPTRFRCPGRFPNLRCRSHVRCCVREEWRQPTVPGIECREIEVFHPRLTLRVVEGGSSVESDQGNTTLTLPRILGAWAPVGATAEGKVAQRSPWPTYWTRGA